MISLEDVIMNTANSVMDIGRQALLYRTIVAYLMKNFFDEEILVNKADLEGMNIAFFVEEEENFIRVKFMEIDND